MSTTTRTRTEIACDSCETVYVVGVDPSGGIDPEGALARCQDCGAVGFSPLDTEDGGRSRSPP